MGRIRRFPLSVLPRERSVGRFGRVLAWLHAEMLSSSLGLAMSPRGSTDTCSVPVPAC